VHTRSVGLLTGGGEFLLAVLALTARNAERIDNAFTRLDVLDGWSNGFDDAAELMAQNVTFLGLNDNTMQDVYVRATDGASSHLDDGVMRLD
jgi:hypothetical protein